MKFFIFLFMAMAVSYYFVQEHYDYEASHFAGQKIVKQTKPSKPKFNLTTKAGKDKALAYLFAEE